MSDMRNLSEVEYLLKLAVEQNNSVTYDQINDILPQSIVSSDKIDELFVLLSKENINIIDCFDILMYLLKTNAFLFPFSSVTVFFLDVQQFHHLVSLLSPMDIVLLLNELHNAYDNIVDCFDV